MASFGNDPDSGNASLTATGGGSSELMWILNQGDIVPGTESTSARTIRPRSRSVKHCRCQGHFRTMPSIALSVAQSDCDAIGEAVQQVHLVSVLFAHAESAHLRDQVIADLPAIVGRLVVGFRGNLYFSPIHVARHVQRPPVLA